MAWGPFGDETRRIGEHHKKDPNLDRSPDFRSKGITFHINFGISENPQKTVFLYLRNRASWRVERPLILMGMGTFLLRGNTLKTLNPKGQPEIDFSHFNDPWILKISTRIQI